MRELKVISEKLKVKNSDDEVVIEAPMMELYYLITTSTELVKDGTTKQKFEAAAYALNEEYKCSLSWAEVLSLWESVYEAVEDAKKNSTPTVE